MASAKLPPVREDKVLSLPHFPSRFHAAVFRLWETVAAERIAEALEIPTDVVLKAAEDMGLPAQKYIEKWTERGYITTIRNAWQILPYGQLLKLLGWSDEQLAITLKDEDFLDIKLGSFQPYKPYCEPVRVEELSGEQEAQLAKIKEIMQNHFGGMFSGAEPFAFFDEAQAGKAKDSAEDLRMIYSYCGLYGNVLEKDIAMSYPDSLLKMYQDAGVNAVWLPGILYQLTPFPFDESYSVGWQERQERLRTLVARAKEYGIKVYLYLNEPRSMPLALFEKYPDLCGRKTDLYGALCTSDPRVLQYLRGAVRMLCEAVPGLGGFFTITCSENVTHCKSRKEGEACARCESVPTQKLVADVLCAISEESRKVDPSIRTIAWTWAWDDFMTKEEIMECIDLLPKEIILQCNSEAQKEFTIGGVTGTIQDYSMSIPGPAELPKFIWNYAKEKGHEVCAKVQVNVTWECSTLPFLPVFDLIREHMTGLGETGVKHLMLSWTLGGYPSINLKVASGCLDDPSEEKYRALLDEEYGEFAPAVEKASKIFSEAFREFPFHLDSLYFGPQNAGPSNLLYEKPSGFGATMTCYSYDDLDTWRAIYPREIYIEQLRKLSVRWREGLAELDAMPDCALKQAAWGGYALFYSSYLQAEFIEKREGGDKKRLREILAEEKELALLMYGLMHRNCLFGYEAANHYYFNKGMLAEKVLNCEYLKERFQ